MKIFQKFFNQDLLEEVEQYVTENRSLPSWYTNTSWSEGLMNYSGQVAILPLEKFSAAFKEIFVNYDNKFKDYEFYPQYCEWHRGSYISWHNDSEYKIGSTLYLNKTWHPEQGGIFLYAYDNNYEDIRCVVPKYNTFVINDENEWHHVTVLNYHSPEIRKTIQIWGNNTPEWIEQMRVNKEYQKVQIR